MGYAFVRNVILGSCTFKLIYLELSFLIVTNAGNLSKLPFTYVKIFLYKVLSQVNIIPHPHLKNAVMLRLQIFFVTFSQNVHMETNSNKKVIIR